MSAGAGGVAGHVLAFARLLRAAGFALGPGRVIDAVQAAAESASSRGRTFTGRCTRCW